MSRRPGEAPLTENSRPLLWVWSLFCTWLKGTLLNDILVIKVFLELLKLEV